MLFAKVAQSSESCKDAILFTTHIPCIECAKLIHQSGIRKVYYDEEYNANKGSGKHFLHNCGIRVGTGFMKYFYEKNNHLIDHKVNKTFDEILWMSDQEFRDWFIELRKTVAQIWDDYGNPPRVGKDEEDIKKQFKEKWLDILYTSSRLLTNLLVSLISLGNHSGLGNAVNQWFSYHDEDANKL